MLILNADLAVEMTDTSQGALNTAIMVAWLFIAVAVLFGTWGLVKMIFKSLRNRRQVNKLKQAAQPAVKTETKGQHDPHHYSAQRLRGEDRAKTRQREERRSQWERERKKSSLK